jgi:hypothetical protein
MLKAFTANSKTILSVDFNRDKTCPQICKYCYVDNMERIYPAYSKKISKNYEWALNDPIGFASQLNKEYRKLRNSKATTWQRLDKLPIRIYGSGDYIPSHYNFLKHLDFKFFIISKTLTMSTMSYHLKLLLGLNNLTSIVLSIDEQNLKNYKTIKSFYKKDRFKIAYTGHADSFKERTETGEKYDIFFNISSKKIEIEKSKNIKEQCPCDSKALAHAKSCSFCNKCWRSEATKSKKYFL